MKALVNILLCALCVSSCTVYPVIKSGDSYVALGGSVMSKTTGENITYSGPLGNITVTSATKDETVVPGKLINYYGVKAATEGAVSMLKTTETTKRVLSSDSVQKASIKSTAEVEKLRILNPVPIQ